MLKLNGLMQRKLSNYKFSESSLNANLAYIVEEGFLSVEDSYVLRHLMARHYNRHEFMDAIGFECFVNKIHVEDYVETNILGQSAYYIMEIFRKWRSDQSDNLLGILSICDESYVLRFHVERLEAVPYLVPDLESYDEALLVVGSNSEVNFSMLSL